MSLFTDLRLPVMCAPMSFASSLDLTLACCRSGVIAGWQGMQINDVEQFSGYLSAIDAARREARMSGAAFAAHAVNFAAGIVKDPGIGAQKLALCEQQRVPLVFSSIGDPTGLVERVHSWGGKVIHDVVTVAHAAKAIAAGVDGLMLTCAGAGGHAGSLTPFAFVPKVRKMFDGLLVVGGGIADGAGVAGALVLGADIACLGTRFIATHESGAVDGHKQMIAAVGMDDIFPSAAMNGVSANWIRQSVSLAGLDPDDMPPQRGPRRGAVMPDGVVPWQDIWSAGHSVGLVDAVESVQSVVDRLAQEFEAADSTPDWRSRIERHCWSTIER
ncbi:MAG: NAD(P)H-dependent flavin oxidoreductase [Acidimicrobiia bacterium]